MPSSLYFGTTATYEALVLYIRTPAHIRQMSAAVLLCPPSQQVVWTKVTQGLQVPLHFAQVSRCVSRSGSQPIFNKKKGRKTEGNLSLQQGAITGEDVSSLETWFEAAADTPTGLCGFLFSVLQKAGCRELEWAIILHATRSSTSSR